MAGFFCALHQVLHLLHSLEAMVGTPEWLSLENKPIITSEEKDTKDSFYWKMFNDLLRTIWHVLKLLWISNSNKPGVDRICRLSYKDHFSIENIKEPLDGVTLFVRILISSNDDADAAYSHLYSEYGNDNDP